MSVTTFGLLHGLGLLPATDANSSRGALVLISMSDIGRFPKSALAISDVMKGKRSWWPASATIRDELKDSVPYDPIGRWFHDGKEYAKSSLEDLRQQAETMDKGESVYFRLGVVTAVAKKGIADPEKLKVVLGTDFQPVFDYVSHKRGEASG